MKREKEMEREKKTPANCPHIERFENWILINLIGPHSQLTFETVVIFDQLSTSID